MSVTTPQNSTCLLPLGFFFYIYAYMLKLAISMAKTNQGAFMSELMRFDNFLNLPSIKHITSSRWLKKSHNIICVCIYSLRLGGKTHSVRELHLLRDFNKAHQKIRVELRLTSRKIYSNNCITASLIFLHWLNEAQCMSTHSLVHCS